MKALGPVPLVAMGMMHCGLQGVLIPMLVAFLSSKRGDNKWLKGYVVFVNVLIMGKTTIHIVQGLDALNQMPPRPSLLRAVPVLTTVLGALVQGFFIFRCWRIFQQRWAPIIPFVALWICTTIFGIKGAVDQSRIAFFLWFGGTLLVELSTTCTTIIYMYRWREDLGKHDGIFSSIWQIIWASAAPAPTLLIVAVVSMCIVKGPSLVAFYCTGISGKFFVLSLMITLLGRGYVNKKLQHSMERSGPSTVQSEMSMQTRTPTFVRGESSAYEFDGRDSSATLQVFTISKKISQSTSNSEESYTRYESLAPKVGAYGDNLSNPGPSKSV